MLIDAALTDALTAQIRTFPRLRQHYDLRDNMEDQSQRMLNALRPGTSMNKNKTSFSMTDHSKYANKVYKIIGSAMTTSVSASFKAS